MTKEKNVKSMLQTTMKLLINKKSINIRIVKAIHGLAAPTLIHDQLDMIDTLITSMVQQLQRDHIMGIMEDFRTRMFKVLATKIFATYVTI